MEASLHCLNCGKQVPHEHGKLFAQVFVCTECHAMAESTFRRWERELKHLLILAQESIRESLTRGQFHPTYQPKEDVSKADLLAGIQTLLEQPHAIH